MAASNLADEHVDYPDPASLFELGIAALKDNDLAQAQQLLGTYVMNQPEDENGWLWLAVAVEQPERKRDCLLRVLALNPNNQQAQTGLYILSQTSQSE